MSEKRIGIAELGIVRPPDSIKTIGLGSCVGIVLYDELKKIGGMVHIMLPESSLAGRAATVNYTKFADTAIPFLYKKLIHEGANRRNICAKIAGGAEMFAVLGQNTGLRVGPRNVEMTKKVLRSLSIPLIAESVGGSYGRTIEFFPDTSVLKVKTVTKGVEQL